MYQVLNLRKVGTEQPQLFELVLKDLENNTPGYFQTTKFGTEPQLREVLTESGIEEAEINRLFAEVF
jgi:hypothetical protein